MQQEWLLICTALVVDREETEAALSSAATATAQAIVSIWNASTNNVRRIIDIDCTSRTLYLGSPPVSLHDGELLENGAGRPLGNRCDMPLQIIDDFAKSAVNEIFLAKLGGQVFCEETRNEQTI
jgi:hypothetical protein